jgi:hypothetical protein
MSMTNWTFLTELYKKAPIEDMFLINKFGAIKKYSPMLEIVVRVESGGMTVATLGKIGDPPSSVKAAKTVTETTLAPAQIFEYDSITEEDVFTQANPELISVSGIQDVVSNKDYIRAVKVQELKNRAMRRKELMIAQILSSGQINYNDGVRSYNVNFGITPENMTISETSKTYEDILEACDEIRKAGHNPDTILVTQNVASAILGNKQIQTIVNKSSFNMGQVLLKTYNNARDLLALPALPIITVYLGTYADDSGAQVPYLGSGDKLIVADSKAFRLGYAAIQNYNISEKPVMGEAFVWENVVNEGTEKAIFLLSRPLPYVVSSDAVKIFNVTVS